MTTLVPTLAAVGAGPATMSSIEIAEACQARHNDVVASIRRLFDQGVLRESRETLRDHQRAEGGRPTKVYDLTKRDTLVVVSGYRPELRARIIDRWEELERAAGVGALPDLSDPEVLRGLLANYARDKTALLAKIEQDAPKVAALEALAETDGSLCITDAAKALQVQPKALFSFLRREAWIYRRAGGSNEVGYQSKVQAGYIEHKVTRLRRNDGPDKMVEQVRITPKGLTRLAAMLEGGHRKSDAPRA